jgi:hypothetical protein
MAKLYRMLKFKKHKNELEQKVNDIERLLFDLVDKLGYVITTDSVVGGEWSFYEIKKVKKCACSKCDCSKCSCNEK